VSVGEVVRVVQGLEEAVGEEGPVSESALGKRVIGPFWEELESDLMARLDAVSVEDLCRQAEQQTIESEGRRSFDFVI
jgi:DNA-binding IscR family transcriptional regulator